MAETPPTLILLPGLDGLLQAEPSACWAEILAFLNRHQLT
jgi:hypothetical protein